MAVPKKRTSVSRKGKRRGGHTHKLHRLFPLACGHCGELTLLHRICPSCGTYKGKQLLAPKYAPDDGPDPEGNSTEELETTESES